MKTREKTIKTLYVMCGCPASGKSTWIKNHIGSDAICVSRDAVRFSIVPEGDEYFSQEKKVYAEFIKQIKDGLNKYDTVYADATHLNAASRTKLLRALGNSLRNVWVEAICIITPLEICLERNDTRIGREFVPKAQIRRMFYSYKMPAAEEGFDAMTIYELIKEPKIGDKDKIITTIKRYLFDDKEM